MTLPFLSDFFTFNSLISLFPSPCSPFLPFTLPVLNVSYLLLYSPPSYILHSFPFSFPPVFLYLLLYSLLPTFVFYFYFILSISYFSPSTFFPHFFHSPCLSVFLTSTQSIPFFLYIFHSFSFPSISPSSHPFFPFILHICFSLSPLFLLHNRPLFLPSFFLSLTFFLCQ